MTSYRFLLILLFSTLFLALLPGFVSAGCCLLPGEGLGCQNAATADNCSATDQTWDPVHSCSELEECALGCCCSPINYLGIGGSNYSCLAPRIFVKDSNTIPGMSCSCGGSFYAISGIVRNGTNSVEGARVSARGFSNYSLANGQYYLNRVPNGTQVIVGATKEGCLPGSTTIANFNSDKTGANSVNIALNCVCNQGDCDATLKAYCESNNNWVIYDFYSDNIAYCSRCRNSDPACAQLDLCVSGDGSCPLSCSPDLSSSDFDSDCICNMTPNGACPVENIFGCNKYNDADCFELNPQCNNGIIEYPYETCEVLPYRQEGQISRCSDTQCSGCNCIGSTRCGNLILEPGEQCEIGMMCANGSSCENCQCGASLCTGNNLKPSIEAEYDPSSQRMFINWSVFGSCNSSVIYYSLFRCENCKAPANMGAFSPLYDNLGNPITLTLPPQKRNWSDSVRGSTDYGYYVKVSYFDKPDGISPVIWKTTGNPICINPHTTEFCMNNNRYRCLPDNTLFQIQDCGTGYCTLTDYSQGRVTRCSNQSVCDFCNGLYGMFANIAGLHVTVQGVSDFSPRYCKINGNAPVVEECYYDRTQSLFNAFNYCSNVSSCFNYKSKEACENWDTNCGGKTNACVWNYTQASKPELGGICRRLQQQNGDCELCDSKEFNWISPGCTPEICKLFGKCYYIGKGSWRGINASCSDQKLMTCSDYNDSRKCLGSPAQAVQVNAIYNASTNMRINGTHQFTPSNDNLELGKCFWYDFNLGHGEGVCLRDADGLRVVSYGAATGWDCASNDIVCNSDFTSPVTTILPRTGCYAGGFYGEDAKISYVASDDRYFQNNLSTYFCLTPEGSTCYPSNLGSNGTYSQTMIASGIYSLFYYSQDPAKNLEVVKNTTIEVDAIPPTFRITNPTEACLIQSGVSTLTLEGIASTDTMFICAKNQRNNRIVCQNNCALNNTPGCIDDSGSFTLNIPVTVGSSLNNITIYMQDRACNYFENSQQAACNNKTLPKVRINITHYYI
jgi:hypothetical protein